MFKKEEYTLYNEKYKKIQALGKGAYGTVYMVEELKEATKAALETEIPNRIYSMKKFYIDNSKNKTKDTKSFVLQQYELLQKLSHPNIMQVVDYFKIKGNECVIYKYYDVDLLQIINTKILNINNEVDARLIRGIMKQILEGIKYLHDQGIIHRDLKPENIMLDKNGIIKLIDFDLARFIEKDKPMSRGVATIYYRPPEIFFGDVNYSFSVDMWAVGCILAEIFLKDPIFKGHNELEVLFKIFEILGSANESNWPGSSELPNYMCFPNNLPRKSLDQMFDNLPKDSLDLLKKLLCLDPKKRLTAEEALKHEFFNDDNATSEELKSALL